MTAFRQSFRLVVALMAFGIAMALAHAGDKVIFSRGSGEVLSPKKQDSINVPAGADDIRGLNDSRPDVAPYIPPPVNRTEPKKTERRTVFDEPKLFSDPLKEKDDSREDEDTKSSWFGGSKEKNDRQSPALTLTDRFGKPTEDRALSPVRQFDWKPEASEDDGSDESNRAKRDSNKEQKNRSLFNSQWKDVVRTSPLRAIQEDSGTMANAGVLNFGDRNSRREREEKREREERRFEFEKLINPGFAPLGSRDPSALGGITSPLETSKAAPAPALTPVPAHVAPGRGAMSPFGAFADQQRSFRPTSFDDLNDKAFGGSVVKPVSPAPAAETAARRPLMSQPTFQDFPGRRF
jgi:hypothetical protein